MLANYNYIKNLDTCLLYLEKINYAQNSVFPKVLFPCFVEGEFCGHLWYWKWPIQLE